MFKIKRRTKESKSGGSFILYVLISLLVIIVFSLITAIVANASENPTAQIGIYSLVALLGSGALCGATISRAKGEGGILTVLLVSLAVSLFMLIVALIAGGGRLTPGSLMNYGCYVGVSTLFAYFGKMKSGRRRHR